MIGLSASRLSCRKRISLLQELQHETSIHKEVYVIQPVIKAGLAYASESIQRVDPGSVRARLIREGSKGATQDGGCT